MSIESTGSKKPIGRTLESKAAPRAGLLLAILLAVSVTSFTAGCIGNLSGQAPTVKEQLSLQFAPASLNFGSVPTGKKTSQAANVTNTSTKSTTITQIVSSSNQFTISGLTFPLTLGPGQGASFMVWFNGSAPGKTAGSLSFQGDAGSTAVEIPVSATAATPLPQLTVSPTNLDAGSATVGSKTNSNITLSNTGTADLTISVITVVGAPFNITGIATPKVISAGQSVSMGVIYAPTAAGSDTGSISIVSNDPASPTNIALSGTGSSAPVGHLTLNPSTLAFGNVSVGSSNVLSSTVTNSGQGAVHISQVFASGSGFTETGLATPATLAPGQSAQVQVTFAPTATGILGGTVGISSDAPGAAPGLALSGTGVQPAISISPASISFGSLVDGQSKSQPVTITNTGTASLTITQLTSAVTGVSVSGVTMPLTIAAGQSSTFNALYAPQTAGNSSGSISVVSNAPTSPSSLAVTGSGVAATSTLAVGPASLSFGNVNVGSSANQTLTITNTGNSSTSISQIGVSGQGLAVSGITTPLTLAAGQATTLTVQFTPAAATSVNGTISITGGQGGTTSVSATGSGVQASLAVSPGSVSFTNVLTGSTNSQAVQITNSGNASLTITQANVSGAGFTATGLSLPATLSPGQSTSLNVQYVPQSAGTVTGTLSLVSNAANASTTVALSGSSLAATHTLSVSPSSLSFGSVSAGSTSTQLVTLTNTGNSSVAVTQITASGTGFALSGAGPVNLTVGQSASFSVQFSPTAAGTDSGSVSIASNASNSPSVSLSGSSPASTYTLSASASSLSFGSVNTGSASTQSVTLTNTGNAQVTISQISVSGTGFALTGTSTNINVAPGMNFSFGVQFSPSAAGNDSGSVSITSNATGSPAGISLSGTGVAQQTQHNVQLSWTSSPSTVVGYNIYRSTVSGSGYTLVNGSLVGPDAFDDITVQGGSTYYYVTTAVDGSGNESGYSNEAQAIVP